MATYKRFLTDALKLPNGLHDVKLPLNVSSDNTHFNTSLSKLYDNYEYLLNNSKILYNFYIEANEDNIVYYINDSGDLVANSISNLSDISLPENTFTYSNMHTYVETLNNVERYMYVMAKQTELDIFVGDDQFDVDYTIETMIKTDNFTKIRDLGNYSFENITSVKITSEKHLLVCDANLKLIIKYDLNDIFYLNSTTTRQRVMEIYNGDRDEESIIDFSPKYLDVDSITNTIFVYETYNNSIFILDKNLNKIRNFSLDNVGLTVSDVKFGSDSNIYILHTNGYLLKYDINGNKLQAGYMRDPLQKRDENEIYLKLSFSSNIEGAFYVLTSSSVFRKYIQRFDENVGSFLLPKVISYTLIGGKNTTMSGGLSAVNANTYVVGKKEITETNYVDITLSNNGKIYILGNNLLLGINDVESFIELYDTTNLTYSIPLSSIQLQDDELEQDFVFNNAFQKIAYNNYLLYHSIDKQAIIDFTDIGEEIFYDTQITLKPELPTNKNLSIGVNEIWSSGVLNRPIENIFNIQSSILEILNTDTLSKEPVTLII